MQTVVINAHILRRKFALIDLVLIMPQQSGRPLVGHNSHRSTFAFLQSVLQ
jgi:hypothetical protein